MPKSTTPKPVSSVAEPKPKPAQVKRPFMSEGVRQDILLHGSAIDPTTGKRLTKDDVS